MFKIGETIPNKGTKGTDYYMVGEAGDKLLFELVDGYIMCCPL